MSQGIPSQQGSGMLRAGPGARDRCPARPPCPSWAAEAAGSMRGEGITAVDGRILQLPSQPGPALWTRSNCQLILLQPRAGKSPAPSRQPRIWVFFWLWNAGIPRNDQFGNPQAAKRVRKSRMDGFWSFSLHSATFSSLPFIPNPRAPGTRQAERIQTFPIINFC